MTLVRPESRTRYLAVIPLLVLFGAAIHWGILIVLLVGGAVIALHRALR